MRMQTAKAFKGFFESQNRYAILYGGAGSGKSVAAAQKMLMRMLSEPGHNFLVVRKVARTLRESVFKLFKEQVAKLEAEALFKFNHANMSIEAFNGNRIVFFGMDNSEKIKSIAGVTGIWIEEATEIGSKDFDQLDLRLRGRTRHYKQIVLTFNPVSSRHWIKKRFFDRRVEDLYTLKTTYLDNPFIDDDYRHTMARLKEENPEYYTIYALGEWGTLHGLVYPSYEIVDALPSYFESEYLGLDFGYNHPYAVVQVRIERRSMYVHELFYRSEWENAKVIEYFDTHSAHLNRTPIYADSARPDLIAEWRRRGWNIHMAAKQVFEGIHAVKGFGLHITKESVHLLDEIDTYVWKQDREGNSLDEPVKLKDDAMDAMRYAITPFIRRRNDARSMKVALI